MKLYYLLKLSIPKMRVNRQSRSNKFARIHEEIDYAYQVYIKKSAHDNGHIYYSRQFCTPGFRR